MVRNFISSESYEIYFNCSFYSQERWWNEGRPNHYIGVFYIVIGVLFEILYIPSIFAMMKKELYRLSCYKIMLFIGIIDMIVLLINAIFSGYQAFVGSVTCNYPLLNYISGVIALAGWIMTSSACLLLSINRIIDMFNPWLSKFLFHGYKTYLWLMIPFIYGLLGCTLSNPPGFTSKKLAWFYDPHFGTSIPPDFIIPSYINLVQVIHNLLVTSVMSIVYIVFCFMVALKYKNSSRIKLTGAKGSLFIQSFIICFTSFVAAAINVYMQYFTTPDSIVIIGHFLWIFTHGFTSVILLVLNKSILRIIRINLVSKFFPSHKTSFISGTKKDHVNIRKRNEGF
uniref:Serpentine Receptor, class T n=1 Tax=Parastrongyloides trichosuri TaxID=131310 RepID=A0A0N4ZD40_PARTI